MADDKPVVLVDGSSYLFRAFHALPKLQSSKGRETGAIKGVIAMIRRLRDDHPDSLFAVVFDASGKTFRNDLYAEYKANRPPMPEELREQIPAIHNIIRWMGLPMLVEAGVEADDVIGTLATRAAQAGRQVLISTGDKDLAQLVGPCVRLVNTMTDTTLDAAGVADKFGVPPERIVDYLALIGDTSDNIPGVPKVGPKTAVKWLGEYQSLDGIIDHADEVKGKVGESLRASLEQLPLSRRLATISTDLPLTTDLKDLQPADPDQAALAELFTELEFKSWLEELGNVSTAVIAEVDYETVLDRRSLERWVKQLAAAKCFAFDTETTSLDYMDAELVGLSFAVTPNHAAYVPLAHAYPDAPTQLPMEAVLNLLRPLLEDAKIEKIGQNLKYDRSVLARYDITLRGIAHDTMLESYVLNSVASRHNLDDLALRYLGRSTVKFEDIAGKGAKQLTFDQIPLEQAAHYAAEDADIALQLHTVLGPKLQAEPTLLSVYRQLEVPLVPVLSRIERRGVLVDETLLLQQSQELAVRMAQLEQQAHDLAGTSFNLASPRQLQEILFEGLGLPVLKKTAKGQPSTAEDVLQELAHDYPLPQVVMEHRALSKLKSTYTDQLPLQINRQSGRIHTSYHQAVAATGRLSSSDPNLQNIPIRTAEGRRVRQAFIAPPGRCLLAADYSQIELRIMAHLSGDEGLLAAFAEDQDVHRRTASEVFAVPFDAVSDEQRRSAKAINFGLIYGMSAFGLARQLGVPRNAAQEYIDLYFTRYPGVRDYMEHTRTAAAEAGFVETLYGRRLYLPEIRSRNFQRRQAAERTAINAPMQGTAADIIKRAMIAVDGWLAEHDIAADIIMQVHDELVLEVDVDIADTVATEVSHHMQVAADLRVPLKVETGMAENWEAAH